MNTKQEEALREYLKEAIVPLIEQVLVKKLGQAMSFAASELVQPQRKPLTDEFNSTTLMSSTSPPQRTWARLMRGVRVDGDTVVITVKGGNDAARELCGELLKEKNA